MYCSALHHTSSQSYRLTLTYIKASSYTSRGLCDLMLLLCTVDCPNSVVNIRNEEVGGRESYGTVTISPQEEVYQSPGSRPNLSALPVCSWSAD